jgi:dihydroxy-acid dehydratase
MVMQELLVAGLLHGDCMTVTGKTVAENLAGVPSVSELGAQDVVMAANKPIAKAGNHIIVLTGTLARESAVMKVHYALHTIYYTI